eukprot:11215172-Lingulodinium_polyedra.AAC.1
MARAWHRLARCTAAHGWAARILDAPRAVLRTALRTRVRQRRHALSHGVALLGLAVGGDGGAGGAARPDVD